MFGRLFLYMLFLYTKTMLATSNTQSQLGCEIVCPTSAISGQGFGRVLQVRGAWTRCLQLMVELPIWKKNILPLTFVVKLEIILRGEELNIKNRWEKIPTGQPPNRITTIIHELEWLSEGCGKVLIANHLVSLLVAEPFDNSPSAQWESELFHWNCVEQVINYIPLYL